MCRNFSLIIDPSSEVDNIRVQSNILDKKPADAEIAKYIVTAIIAMRSFMVGGGGGGGDLPFSARIQ